MFKCVGHEEQNIYWEKEGDQRETVLMLVWNSKLDCSGCSAFFKHDSLPVIELAAMLLTTEFFYPQWVKGVSLSTVKHKNINRCVQIHTETHLSHFIF